MIAWDIAVAGTLVAAAVSGLAVRRERLTPRGGLAAVGLGALAAAAGAGWAAFLLGYFVSSTALSRLGAARRARRTAGVVAKGGARDALQVLANGGGFGLAAVGALGGPVDWPWGVMAAGALAASAADTWATEIGTVWGGRPRHILTWRPLAPGLSGGVSGVGTLALALGAVAMAAWAVACRLVPPAAALAVAAGGAAGAMADSLAGALLQERRRCQGCGAATEQFRHVCGGATVRVGGVPGLGNDAVNVVATVTGAAVAAWLALPALRTG